MKKDIKHIEASVRALLQNKAKETNRPFAEVLQYYGMERFLYWKAFLRKGDIKHAPEKLAITAKGIEEFLIKPLDAINKGNGFNEEWKAPGSWK